MSHALTQLLWPAVIVTVMVIAVEFLAGRVRLGVRRGTISICIGLGLLIFGSALSVVGPRNPLLRVPPLNRPLTRVFLRERICLSGGAFFLACGIIWRVAAVIGHRDVKSLRRKCRRTADELSSAQEVLHSIVRSSVSGVMILDTVRDEAGIVVDFRCRFMNDEAEQMLNRKASVLLGEPLLQRVPCIKTEGLLFEAVNVLETRRPFRDERCCSQDGREKWFQIAIVKHGDGLITTFTDVSRRKRTEEELRRTRRHDALTDLASRPLLIDRVAQAITRRKRLPEYTFAVLLLDLDRFKIINDSLGHEIGDQLLISVANRLRANLREIDMPSRIGGEHVPSRLGGDEFVVLLDGIADARASMIVAERLQDALGQPYIIEGHEVTTSASIGIVTSDGEYERPEDVLRDADTAMYQAKNTGKARSVIFDERMHKEVLERLTLEKELRQATEEQGFMLNYQPIVTLETLALKGFEALIRWPHPRRGIVPPDKFIGLSEELGLIIPIGEWVLREAGERLQEWRERRPGGLLSMTVNLSKKQLMYPDLISFVAGVIKQFGIDPPSFVLEVTESMIMDDIDELTPVLAGLREMGVRLAMDDFGTGHSSLSFLHKVPMDILKIDRSFIMRSGKADRYDAIIQAIVQLAHNLDMEVVAEGVETPEQVALLKSLNCDFGQGYFFSRPLKESDAAEVVANDERFRKAA